MKRFLYDIFGISEVRRTGQGETQNGDFIWSGEDNIHARSIELLLSTKAKKELIECNLISSRIFTATFNATLFKLTIINVYASISSSSEEKIKTTFYIDIENALAKILGKHIFIITGD